MIPKDTYQQTYLRGSGKCCMLQHCRNGQGKRSEPVSLFRISSDRDTKAYVWNKRRFFREAASLVRDAAGWMQKTDHYKEINFHAGHRVTGGRVYAYFVSTMERLPKIIDPLIFQRVWWWSVGGSNRDAQPVSLEKRGGRTPSPLHLITHLITFP